MQEWDIRLMVLDVDYWEAQYTSSQFLLANAKTILSVMIQEARDKVDDLLEEKDDVTPSSGLCCQGSPSSLWATRVGRVVGEPQLLLLV